MEGSLLPRFNSISELGLISAMGKSSKPSIRLKIRTKPENFNQKQKRALQRPFQWVEDCCLSDLDLDGLRFLYLGNDNFQNAGIQFGGYP